MTLQGIERFGNSFYPSMLHRRLADSVQSVDEHQPPSNLRKLSRQNRSSLPPRFCSSASLTPLAVKSNRIGQNCNESPTSIELYPVWNRQINPEIKNNDLINKNEDADDSFLNIRIGYEQYKRNFGDSIIDELHYSTGFGELPIKHARRTSITEYNVNCNNRPKSLSTKCVNFAPILATLAGDEEEEYNKKDICEPRCSTEIIFEKQGKSE